MSSLSEYSIHLRSLIITKRQSGGGCKLEMRLNRRKIFFIGETCDICR